MSRSFLFQQEGDRAGLVRKGLQGRAALGGAALPGQPHHGHAQGGQPGREGGAVLLGEQVGRRHERALVPGLHGLQQCQRGDQCLAGADIALQQAQHRPGAFQVVADLGDHALLRAGEAKRQRRAQRPL